jgi:hypothetical protein
MLRWGVTQTRKSNKARHVGCISRSRNAIQQNGQDEMMGCNNKGPDRIWLNQSLPFAVVDQEVTAATGVFWLYGLHNSDTEGATENMPK